MNIPNEDQVSQGASNEERSKGPSPPVQPKYRDPREYYRQDPRRKSPGLAALLSLMPGLGQVYLGYYQQGFINIIVVGSFIGLLNLGVGELEPLAGFFLAFFWLYNMIDAARRASFYNQALIGLDPFSLPDGAEMPGTRGSLLGGVVLVFFGLLFFTHTMFDLSLAWIKDWWPLALILVGGYLIYKDYADRQGRAEQEV